jgi:beta-galactosidase/beta-glucuronidase
MNMPQWRADYPRPQFVRKDWLNLNGAWEFEFDDGDVGERERWYDAPKPLSRSIQVPFCFQSPLSGIGIHDFHDIVWYRKRVELPPDFAGKRVLLHFGAVDYFAKVWVNGQLAALHEGGHTPFWADVTEQLRAGGLPNDIVVRAQDYSRDVRLPRGKQYWLEKPVSVFYSRTTGIWQTVWMEPVAETRIGNVRFTPDIDANEIRIQTVVHGYSTAKDRLKLKLSVSLEGQAVAEDILEIREAVTARRIWLTDYNDMGKGRWWSPENPVLYDIEMTLWADDVLLDRVNSYFGMRKISVEDGRVYLNNRPYYMKLVLDQGYYPDGILTPPNGEAVRRDAELAKAMGFNGVRKHQKIEDPRYAYWCDRIGLLLWGEMPNAYAYSEEYVRRMAKEWQEALERDYNHPCIVVWVPLNESWGVPGIMTDQAQQHHALSMYHLTKSLDPTRLVVSNDGWEHVRSDICTIHDYDSSGETLGARYGSKDCVKARPCNRPVYVPGYAYDGEPIQVSEFGGIRYSPNSTDGWGYSEAHSEEQFLKRYMELTHALLRAPALQGYCYTQLADVQQEKNGLLTEDRQPKAPLSSIRSINQGLMP